MVSAVVWHLVLGHQHALVRNTSVAAVSELVHEAAGGPEPGHIVNTWFHSATWVSFQKGTDFLVGCREEVGIAEGLGKGVNVGVKDGWVFIGNCCEGHGDFWSLGFENPCMRMVRMELRSGRKPRRRR